MAAIPRTDFDLATISPDNSRRVVGCNAGEKIDAGLPCTIRADGLIYRAFGTDRFMGLSMTNVDPGEGLTLMHGVVFRMNHGLTPMTPVYLPAAAGNLDTTATGAILGVTLPDNRVLIFAL